MPGALSNRSLFAAGIRASITASIRPIAEAGEGCQNRPRVDHRRIMWAACVATMRVSSRMQVQDSDISAQYHDWVYLTANIAAKYTR
jgi:hypothetical protein